MTAYKWPIAIKVEPSKDMPERMQRAYAETLLAEIERHFGDEAVQKRISDEWFVRMRSYGNE